MKNQLKNKYIRPAHSSSMTLNTIYNTHYSEIPCTSFVQLHCSLSPRWTTLDGGALGSSAETASEAVVVMVVIVVLG